MWIEWGSGLLNLKYVKEVYLRSTLINNLDKKCLENQWYIHMLLNEDGEIRLREFDSEEIAKKEYKRLKNILIHSDSMYNKIKC